MSGIIEAEVPGFGKFRVEAKDLDWAIDHFLPASPAVLSSLYEEVMGVTVQEGDRPTVSELLVMLTEQYRGRAGQALPVVQHHQVARIVRLRYTFEASMGEEVHFWVFKEGQGYTHDGQDVALRPPGSCFQLPTTGPTKYLIRNWPDIKDKVHNGFVLPVLVLEGLP